MSESTTTHSYARFVNDFVVATNAWLDLLDTKLNDTSVGPADFMPDSPSDACSDVAAEAPDTDDDGPDWYEVVQDVIPSLWQGIIVGVGDGVPVFIEDTIDSADLDSYFPTPMQRVVVATRLLMIANILAPGMFLADDGDPDQ